MKILIAEDDRVSALVLRRGLETLGYDVVVATNGDDAWNALRDREIRVVVSDWMMPGVDGLELCRRIRARSDGPYVYFMLLSAKEFREDRHHALAVGADDFLVKPLDRAELAARLSVARRLLSMEEQLRNRTLELERARIELERRNQALEEMATTDALTGIKNRRYFMERLETCFSFAQRRSMPISVMMIDVDHFKQYNDAFGHAAGDEVLVDFARILRSNLRDHDVLARFGGEEFVALLPATDRTTSRSVAERLVEAITSSEWPRRPVTASLGIATIDDDVMRPVELVELADQALYLAKASGRNRVVHLDECRIEESATPV